VPRALAIADYGIAVGGKATLFTIPAIGVLEAVAAHPPRKPILFGGGSSPATAPYCRPQRQSPECWLEPGDYVA